MCEYIDLCFYGCVHGTIDISGGGETCVGVYGSGDLQIVKRFMCICVRFH